MVKVIPRVILPICCILVLGTPCIFTTVLALAFPSPLDLPAAVAELYRNVGRPVCYQSVNSNLHPQYSDCLDAGILMESTCPAGPSFDDLTHFSVLRPNRDSQDYRIPLLWTVGTCQIELEVSSRSPVGWDDATWRSLGQVAADIVQSCVGTNTGLGGRAITGQASRLKLSVYHSADILWEADDVGTMIESFSCSHPSLDVGSGMVLS